MLAQVATVSELPSDSASQIAPKHTCSICRNEHAFLSVRHCRDCAAHYHFTFRQKHPLDRVENTRRINLLRRYKIHFKIRDNEQYADDLELEIQKFVMGFCGDLEMWHRWGSPNFEKAFKIFPEMKYVLGKTSIEKYLKEACGLPPAYLVDFSKLVRNAQACFRCGSKRRKLKIIEKRTVPIPRIQFRIPYSISSIKSDFVHTEKGLSQMKGCVHHAFSSLETCYKLAYEHTFVCKCSIRVKNHVHYDSFEQAIGLCRRCAL